jgi:hypothetical protein
MLKTKSKTIEAYTYSDNALKAKKQINLILIYIQF